ncbi:hypothetical protein Tco_0689782 [Tanacetum coccineum]
MEKAVPALAPQGQAHSLEKVGAQDPVRNLEMVVPTREPEERPPHIGLLGAWVVCRIRRQRLRENMRLMAPRNHLISMCRPDSGKVKVTDVDESPPKLLIEEQIQAHLDKKEKLEKAIREARLSKPKLIKVIHEEATKARVDPKALTSREGGQEFIKIQDAGFKVLNRKHYEKIKKSRELRKKMIERYKCTTSSRLKPETITDIKIHPNTKPVAITVYRALTKETLMSTNLSSLVILVLLNGMR